LGMSSKQRCLPFNKLEITFTKSLRSQWDNLNYFLKKLVAFGKFFHFYFIKYCKTDAATSIPLPDECFSAKQLKKCSISLTYIELILKSFDSKIILLSLADSSLTLLSLKSQYRLPISPTMKQVL